MARDYKEYSLGKLEEWLHDCLNAAEASPQEIYDKIKKVVQEEYYYYKNGASRTNELLQLLNGTVQFHIDPAGNKVQCDVDDNSEYCKGAWNDFWEEYYYPEEFEQIRKNGGYEWTPEVKRDKVKKWVLPVEECNDSDTGETEYFVSFPDDLLEATDLKEGDQVEWVDQGDGSYLLRKLNALKSGGDEKVRNR